MTMWQKIMAIIVTIASGTTLLLNTFAFDNTIASWANLSQFVFYIFSTILVLMAIFAFRKELKEKKKKQKLEKTREKLKLGKTKPEKIINTIINIEDNVELLHIWIEKIGKEAEKIMVKIKAFLDKYKGYLATALTGLLAILNEVSGLSENLFNEFLVINGTDYLAMVLWALPVVIGVLSNGFTSEFWNEIVTKWKTQNEAKETEAAIIKEEVSKIDSEIKAVEVELVKANKEVLSLGTCKKTLESNLAIREDLVSKGKLTSEVLEDAKSKVLDNELAINAAQVIVDELNLKLIGLNDKRALFVSEDN